MPLPDFSVMTFQKNFAHVHGIIMYSDNKDEADTILENNKNILIKV